MAVNKVNLDELRSLLPWATEVRRAQIEAVIKAGNYVAAGEAIGVRPHAIRSTISKLRKTAARNGWDKDAELATELSPGFHVKGRSTMRVRDKDSGEMVVRAEWIKTDRDRGERLESIVEAFRDIASEFEGFAEPVPPPEAVDRDPMLLNVMPMGDPHFGMLSWGEETGEDFDLKIAEENLAIAVDQLFRVAPPARDCLIINAGDYYHADNSMATTTRGTKVDVDSRRIKMYVVGIRAMHHAIHRALETHDKVTVICEIGNHDTETSLLMAINLAAWYRQDPRVVIDTSPQSFHWYRHGLVLLGTTHGDKAKPAKLPSIMACDRAKDWGETKFRHWYVGHVHHQTISEFNGCTVETLRTLAATDAWHHGQGYRSGRTLQLDTWHAEHGRECQQMIGIRRIKQLGGK